MYVRARVHTYLEESLGCSEDHEEIDICVGGKRCQECEQCCHDDAHPKHPPPSKPSGEQTTRYLSEQVAIEESSQYPA